MINCYCVKCGARIETTMFAPSKILIECSKCKTKHLISLSPEELCVKVKKSLRDAK